MHAAAVRNRGLVRALRYHAYRGGRCGCTCFTHEGTEDTGRGRGHLPACQTRTVP